MNPPRYEHRQIGWWTLGPIALLIGVTSLVLLRSGIALGAAISISLLAALVLLFGWLTVRIDADSILIRFGIGLIRRRVPLSRVRGHRAVTNRWFYGWGIRLIPGGLLYNVSGFDAVELDLDDGSRLRIGTDEPAALGRALEPALGAATPAPGDRRLNAGVALTVLAPAAIVIFAAAVMAGVLIAAGARSPAISVSADAFTVRHGSRVVTVPSALLISVTLEDSLPRVIRRDNGFSFAGIMRGRFTLDGLGQGWLFVDRDTPPFIVARTVDGFVILNFDDPARTQAVFADIQRLR